MYVYNRTNDLKLGAGVGVDKPNPWAFDTTQFDNILKKLKVVLALPFVYFLLISLEMIFNPYYCVLFAASSTYQER